ncbi:MAG: CvpA family protein [Verrucomicrobiota bacterium]
MNNLNKLPCNWFDLLVVVVLLVGLSRGRKHGMSEELMSVLKWLAIAFGCAFLYQPIGTAIASPTSVFNTLSGYIMAYLGVALAITAVFALLKKVTGEKVVSADAFGRTEFYLGMMAGMVRFACMLVAALALLNARNYNQSEIQKDIKYQNDMYGSNFFPKLYTVQSQVFISSLSGSWIKQNLGFLLIKSTTPEKKELKRKEVEL